MTVSPADAALALREIDASASRSREFRGYRIAAPHFFLWGAIWIIGYGVTGFDVHTGGILWLVLTVAGLAASVAMTRGQHGRLGDAARKAGQRVGLSSLAFVAFMIATYAILPPHTVNQMNAFPALLVGMSYVIVGIWMYRRFLWLGAAIIAATLLGYFLLAPWFSFWMAAVGGGGLVLTGLWMRRA